MMDRIHPLPGQGAASGSRHVPTRKSPAANPSRGFLREGREQRPGKFPIDRSSPSQ
ncbi:hypothetical protein [Neobacillus niacini]|uniref:hypothetical protein n=1 Tax=Neobacillus niacini TaxID=86668 RepID=UPI00286A8DCC|nr:hypothetical protein [Neobacillus niacini]